MKPRLFSACLAIWVIVAAGVLTTGCTLMDRVSGQFSEFFETAMAEGDERVVFETAQQALEGMGYRYERGGLSTHRLEMSTAVQPGGNAQNLRQRRVVVAFRAMGSEGTEVKIGFWETSEEVAQSDNAVTGSRLIRGGTLYQAFWDRLEKGLPEPSAGEPSAPPAAAR